jgi:Kef-type K+ transport system membrane component KefB
MKLNAENITLLFLSLALMLFTARLFGEIFIKLKQPAVIGEIFAGIILGPTFLGMIAPGWHEIIYPPSPEIRIIQDGISILSVVLLLLVSGLEVDLSILLKQGKTASLTSIMGIIFPFIIGFSAAFLFPQLFGRNYNHPTWFFALFIGTALSISALPVIAKTLLDLKIFKSHIGSIIIAAAMFNDLIGWIIFSVLLSLIGGGVQKFSLMYTIIYLFVFIFSALILLRRILSKTVEIIQNKFSSPGAILNFILMLGFFCAALTEYIGVHAIFGAFIIGIAIGDSVHLKEKTREIIHQFVTNIFAPLFFVSIGLKVNFITNFDFVVVAVIVLLAFAGKVIGGSFGARLGGLSKKESLIVGFGMNSRGAMEIILGLLALENNLIQEVTFVALVIMALITSLSSAPIMNYLLKRKEDFNLNNLLLSKNSIISYNGNKEFVINELSSIAAKSTKLSSQEIIKSVMEREEQLATGIANHLAIPHAKLKISKPFIAFCKHQSGVDFGAADGIPAQFIFLLLTPEDKNELQLNLLAEIVKKFDDLEKVKQLLPIEDKNKLVAEIKAL